MHKGREQKEHQDEKDEQDDAELVDVATNNNNAC
jgi:hypothetical protein